MIQHGPITASDNQSPPIRMDGVVYHQVSIRHPFTVSPPTGDDWRLYVVRGHGVVLNAPNLFFGELALPSGTVIGMTGQEPHQFLSMPAGLLGAAGAPWEEHRLGAQLPPPSHDHAVIVVGRIPQSSMPFLALMGGFVRVDPLEYAGATSRIGMLIDLIAENSSQRDPSSDGIIQRLAEIITLEIGRVGRTHSVLFGKSPEVAEYDARIYRAITAICKDPQNHWTVGSMAQVAGMSRSAFAARYHETVGQTPMRSLRRLRMHRAAMTLAQPGSLAIARVAEDMGYASDAAFNRAFAKEFGHPPKRYGMAGRFGLQ